MASRDTVLRTVRETLEMAGKLSILNRRHGPEDRVTTRGMLQSAAAGAKITSMRKSRLLVAGAILLSLAGRARADDLLTTEDFDAGKITMADASDDALKGFLADLQTRRNYDEDCHNGNPGPDADFLNSWIDKTMTELESRGYKIDDAGNPVKK
jgi:hypothetical protein